MHQSRGRSWAVIIVIALLAGACSSGGKSTGPDPYRAAPANRSAEGPLQVRLSTGQATTAPSDPIPVVGGEPLDPDRIASITSRLDPLEPDEDDVAVFHRPPETLPPPTVGATVDQPFPNGSGEDAPAPEVPAGPLEVVRFQPEGAVEIAPAVSVTFNQPMVPLTSLNQLEAEEVPATISPEVPGRWRWIGTRTLRFEPATEVGGVPLDRLPMATSYRVEIAAGTTSQSGAKLAQAVTWEFETPPVSVRSVSPLRNSNAPKDSDHLPLTPVLVAVFDQVIDPGLALGAVAVTADDRAWAMRPATEAEIAADEQAHQVVTDAPRGRYLAFRPVDPFPADAAIVVAFNEGLASAEGPLTSVSRSRFFGQTFPRLAVARAGCGDLENCQPNQPLVVEMTTRLDQDGFDRSRVSVRPELPGSSVQIYGDRLVIAGATRADTTYQVTLPGGLRDVFGQTLGRDETVDITVGAATPAISGLEQSLVTLDPFSATPTLPISTIGHDELHITVHAVTPADWPQYRQVLNRWDRQELPSLPDWPLLAEETVRIGTPAGTMGETWLDLGPYLAGPGHVVLTVEPTQAPTTDDWFNRPRLVWVQRTTVGLDVLVDQRQLFIWATDLTTGSPIPGVEIDVPGLPAALSTNRNGLAQADGADIGDLDHLVARHGDDQAILDTEQFAYHTFEPAQDQARWHIMSDRGLYRPGEQARFKGWVRRLTTSSDAQLARVGEGARVVWVAHDAFGNEIDRGEVALGHLDSFDFAVEVLDGAGLGTGWIELELIGTGDLTHQMTGQPLHLAEFRRPEFEVAARPESPGPYLVTEPATVAVTAEYLSGGSLSNAPVDWTVTTRPGRYRPPGWDRFAFGVWIPWWLPTPLSAEESYTDFGPCCFPGDEPEVKTFVGHTDPSGTHFLRMDFDGTLPGRPAVVRANAAVTDVNRQQLADTTELLVHAGSHYVGLRTEQPFVEAGRPFVTEVVVTDIDGHPVTGRTVAISLERLEWGYIDGEWEETGTEVDRCEATPGAEPATCPLTPEIGGRYRIVSIVEDDAGGTNRTELDRWVTGAQMSVPDRSVEHQELTLVPNAETYGPGDTAEVLVQAPFSTGTGLLTVARNGIETTETFPLTDGSAVVEIPIRAEHVPGLDLMVQVAGVASDDNGPALRPAFATSTLQLSVPPAQKALAVEVVPADPAVQPGQQTAVTVSVTDADGTAVADAALAVVVVDEAVLSLTDYQLADPLDSLFTLLHQPLNALYGRQSILLAAPSGGDDHLDQVGRERFGPDAAGGFSLATADGASEESAFDESAGSDSSAVGPTITERTNFDALALFEPDVLTDAEGQATIAVPLPDNLTRYRVMVTAASGVDHFGIGEANITARLPVQARPSAPRFLNFGDQFELPVVVQNQTDEPLRAQVVVEATNLALTSPAGLEVEVPANDRVEVRFPTAAATPGTARIRTAVVAGSYQDAITVELPVFTPSTAEAFATYGVIDEGGIAQTVRTPSDVVPQFGSLDITTGSTSLQSLTDAVIDLTSYRYDHVDALASRVLAIVALRDVLGAFGAEDLPSPAQLEARMTEDLGGLVNHQNHDGGFGTWYRGTESDPYRSIQATHALIAARDAGYAVDAEAVNQALAYVGDIERHLPSDWSTEIRSSLAAYAFHVRYRAGDHDRAGADRLFSAATEDLSVDGLAWLWPVASDPIATEIGRLLRNRVTETPSTVTFATDYGDDAHLILGSDRRSDGIALDALIRMDPTSDLIPKVVNGLIANQRQGAWGNVQENSFVLLALKNYFDTYEATTPDFVARSWLGDLYASESTYQGRSTDSHRTSIPMSELLARSDPSVVLTKAGAGRLYYRLGLRYAPADLVLPPRDEGFVVERSYEAVTDPGDVRRQADGTWIIRAGATVRVNLTMVADGARQNMALVDPVPAGLEIMNPDLATAVELPPDPTDDDRSIAAPWRWYGTWFDHQSQRDDRAEAFAGYLPAGVYDYSYVARATTPGTFVVPPAQAEELYSPEVFGRTSTDRVVVSAS